MIDNMNLKREGSKEKTEITCQHWLAMDRYVAANANPYYGLYVLFFVFLPKW